jgi:FAD synthase
MIMGVPENKSIQSALSFVRIPFTEECKLLPATGIYAVSVISGETNSKGMAVICKSDGMQPEVLLHIFENEDLFTGKSTEILFHKMIHGSVSLSDAKTTERLMLAKAEISDLIY